MSRSSVTMFIMNRYLMSEYGDVHQYMLNIMSPFGEYNEIERWDDVVGFSCTKSSMSS